jgi:hypothetical protein
MCERKEKNSVFGGRKKRKEDTTTTTQILFRVIHTHHSISIHMAEAVALSSASTTKVNLIWKQNKFLNKVRH